MSTGKFARGVPSYSPDDDLYKHLCSVYSDAHAYMHRSSSLNITSKIFKVMGLGLVRTGLAPIAR